jgi:hypothetical protein
MKEIYASLQKEIFAIISDLEGLLKSLIIYMALDASTESVTKLFIMMYAIGNAIVFYRKHFFTKPNKPENGEPNT